MQIRNDKCVEGATAESHCTVRTVACAQCPGQRGTRAIRSVTRYTRRVDYDVPAQGPESFFRKGKPGRHSGCPCAAMAGNWRMTFTFDGADAVLVDYLDYH